MFMFCPNWNQLKCTLWSLPKNGTGPKFGQRLVISVNAEIIAVRGESFQEGIFVYKWNRIRYDFFQKIRREGCGILPSAVSMTFLNVTILHL